MKIAAVALLSLLLLCVHRKARACTGVYVGRKLNPDGDTIIARTLDLFPLTTLMRMDIVPAARNAPGRFLCGTDGFSWPLPEQTFRYVCTPAVRACGRGRYASAAVSERGVAVTGTVTAYIRPEIRRMDPPLDGGLCEEVLPDLIASCCATAREGVDLIARVMAERGSAEQNILMIADPRETWYVETYTGRQWAALRLPEDRMAVFGNEFMLDGFSGDEEGFLCSPDLFRLPKEHGLAVYDPDGKMNLFRTYAGRFSDFANGRTWLGRLRFAPKEAGEYRTDRKFSLCFSPERPGGALDVMELFRDRFEGTGFCPEETGRRDWRVLGSESTCTSHVLCVSDRTPEAAACVGWFSLGNAEHSVYLPVSSLVTELDPSCTLDMEEAPHYDAGYAAVRMKRLCALAEQDRGRLGRPVRAAFRRLEEESFAQAARISGRAAAFLRAGDRTQAERLWTDFSLDRQKAALQRADRLFEEMIWYLMDTTDSYDYDYRWRTMETEPRKPRPFEPSCGG